MDEQNQNKSARELTADTGTVTTPLHISSLTVRGQTSLGEALHEKSEGEVEWEVCH